MVRTAAAEIGFSNQSGQPPAELVEQGVQLLAVRRGVEGPATEAHISAFFAREADEANARVALAIVLAPSDGIREAFFAVESKPGRDQHVARPVPAERDPERF